MNWQWARRAVPILQLVILTACGGGPATVVTQPPPPPGGTSYDLDALGAPRFISNDYIELNKIERISRFRSAVGHSYTDSRESCRSMKHYFLPAATVAWGDIAVRSPVTGSIVQIREEWAGNQYLIQPVTHPAFTVIIFHLTATIPLAVGTSVTAGQLLGHHVGAQTMSDIAVGVNTPTGYRLVSWFDVMTNELLASYTSRGVASRSSMAIGRAERDANSLTCNGETFTGMGTLSDWVVLQ